MSAFPLRLAPAPSARLGFALGAAHLAAGLLWWVASVPHWARFAGVAMVGASFAYHWLRDVRLRLPGSAVGLELTWSREAGLRCEIALRGGRRLSGPVLGGSVALPWIVVISLRPDGSRRTRQLMLLRDALSPEEFRALRVALRWR